MRIFLSVLLFLLAVAWGHAASVAFKVEASIDEKSLSADFYQTHGGFYVDTEVTNTSDRDQGIIAWSQHGWSWVSSRPEVEPDINALQNIPVRIVLKPNQKYAGKLEMWADQRHKTGPITFRLGFAPEAELPISGLKNIRKRGVIFWSNTIKLTR
jgi:hypothetical protein